MLIIYISLTINKLINLIIKSKVKAKKQIKRLKSKLIIKSKRKKKDKVIDFTISTNDSLNNNFIGQNNFSNIDFKSINSIYLKIKNNSYDFNLTNLDNLIDINLIIDKSIKILQLQLKLNLQ